MIDSSRNRLPLEKLYLQLDKGNYVQGDTIWFKAYLLDADFLTPSPRSGLLYVELDDSENRCVNRMLLPVASGLSWGCLALVEKEIPEGSYTLRAYTNWMRNFGEDYVFKKNLYITPSGSKARLVTASFKQVKNNIEADILLTDQDKHPARLRDMQLWVMNGKHNLFSNKLMAGMDGKLNVNFNLPDNTPAKNLSILAKEITRDGEGSSLTIPVTVNGPEAIDLQFMPEGGHLVNGIPAKIGFKAIGEDGKGTEVSGSIYNSKQEEITSFKSVHRGMGSFGLTPQAGETYTARLILPNGTTKTYLLPAVNSSGTSMRISQSDDTLQVRVAATPGLIGAAYYLIGQSRGVVCYIAQGTFNGERLVYSAPKAAFPTGIAHFTLLNAAHQPLNERLVYIDHQDELKITATTDQKSYTPHDSIALHIAVKDSAGKPVRGSFSIAVTDDSQVKADSTDSNILNSLLLTSDLKGSVEEPGYYLENNAPEKIAALDNLLLTQGWVGYDWNQVYGPVKPPAFAAEGEFTVSGRVTNMFNKPVANSGITLLSHKPFRVIDTVTNKDGRFAFKGLLPVDTASFLIQARRKDGSSFNIGIDVDEFKPPVFAQSKERTIPWYVNSDTLLLHNKSSKLSQQMAEAEQQGYGHLLKEVTIKGKKIIKDSKNLIGPGQADFILDEKDMDKAKKMTLFDLLEKKVPGFQLMGTWQREPMGRSVTMYYMIGDKRIAFIFDGIRLEQNFKGGSLNDYYMFVKDYLDSYTAEDIKGIEVMTSEQYTAVYTTRYLSPMTYIPAWTFIEITTRSGAGPFIKKTPGVYIYKPLPFTSPKQFYSPRYIVKDKVIGTDLRSTIYWKPNVVTDTTGKATVYFYSADKPANYTIIMQGTDLKGRIGFTQKRILIHRM